MKPLAQYSCLFFRMHATYFLPKCAKRRFLASSTVDNRISLNIMTDIYFNKLLYYELQYLDLGEKTGLTIAQAL